MPSSTKAGLTSLLLIGSLLAALAPVQAQNIVKDGDFETANPGQTGSTFDYSAANPFDTNWVIGGTVGIDLNNVYVYDGSKSLYLNDDDQTADSVTQNLSTTVGQTYTLSFEAGADFSDNELDVAFGNTTFTPIIVPDNGFSGPPPGNNGLFTSYSFLVTATSPFTGLTFSSPIATGPSYGTLELDDISVTPAAAVPEASTTVSFGLLLALGLGGVVIAKKRQARA